MPRRAPAKQRGAARSGARAGFHVRAAPRRPHVVTADHAAGTRGGRRGDGRVRLRTCLRLFVCACLFASVRWGPLGSGQTSVSHAVGQRTTADFSSGSAHPSNQTHTQPSADARTSAGSRRAGTDKTASQSAIQHTQTSEGAGLCGANRDLGALRVYYTRTRDTPSAIKDMRKAPRCPGRARALAQSGTSHVRACVRACGRGVAWRGWEGRRTAEPSEHERRHRPRGRVDDGELEHALQRFTTSAQDCRRRSKLHPSPLAHTHAHAHAHTHTHTHTQANTHTCTHARTGGRGCKADAQRPTSLKMGLSSAVHACPAKQATLW
jgi:hypothetical protein